MKLNIPNPMGILWVDILPGHKTLPCFPRLEKRTSLSSPINHQEAAGGPVGSFKLSKAVRKSKGLGGLRETPARWAPKLTYPENWMVRR